MAKLDFNTPEEKDTVQLVYGAHCCCIAVALLSSKPTNAVSVSDGAMALLSEADRELAPVQSILPLLKSGIGVHHSGLLPIVKEMVELLFQEQLIKVLFATETFAMGLNMPARTVVFTQTRKWDGEEHRWMASGEYVQMSGRAGRRGKDVSGICIVMCGADMELESARTLMKGATAPLVSSFKLTYYTLLNMLKRTAGEIDMERIIAKSFHQFQHEAALPEHAKRLQALEAQADAIELAGEVSVAEFEALKQEIAEAGKVMLTEMLRPERSLRFLRSGRLVRVRVAGADYGWGVVCAVTRKLPPAATAAAPAQPADATSHYVVDTLLRVLPPLAPGSPPRPSPDGVAGELGVLPVALPCLSALSALMVQLPEDLRSPDARAAVGLALDELHRRFPAGLPRLDPVQDMGITEPRFVEAARRVEALEPKLLAHPLFGPSAEAQRFGGAGSGTEGAAVRAAYERKAALKAEASQLRSKMRASALTQFHDELRSRSAVLKRLGHVDAAGVVQLKGRAACEIDTGDELLITELMFDGLFGPLSPAACAAVCSCFVPTEKSKEGTPVRQELAAPLAALHAAATRIATVQLEAGLDVSVDDYVDCFKQTLMDVVYRWSNGCEFSELLKVCDLFEGTIIRAVRRLDELLGQLAVAAAAVGDLGLKAKFEAAALSLRHGIMFSNSLYL